MTVLAPQPRPSRIESQLPLPRQDPITHLPILVLYPHSRCNCRCLMCDIWQANSVKRELSREDIEQQMGALRNLHVQRIALSGGERRRVEIARSLATHPSYILLDEPLAGIDPIAVNDIRDLVMHLKDRGIGVLITDHNVRDALDIIDRAYIIHEGQVLKEGTPAEIVGDRDVRRVYLGERFSL